MQRADEGRKVTEQPLTPGGKTNPTAARATCRTSGDQLGNLRLKARSGPFCTRHHPQGHSEIPSKHASLRQIRRWPADGRTAVEQVYLRTSEGTYRRATGFGPA